MKVKLNYDYKCCNCGKRNHEEVYTDKRELTIYSINHFCKHCNTLNNVILNVNLMDASSNYHVLGKRIKMEDVREEK